ncbi:peptidoglycan-binding protein [Microbacterium sp. NPDC019599]|uniref:peptidoglycan-binding protein n=1 Tax=Microbacterium sp. NPDC019599 TaxID=3154690 RepID=UPI0033EE517F
MKSDRRGSTWRLATTLAVLTVAAIGLAGCSGEVSAVDRASARVSAKEKAVTAAETALAAASGEFCGASKDYITALDRYADILNDTAPTVGDVRDAGSDLAEPREGAVEGAQAAVEAQEDLAVAQQELADAQAALAAAQAGSTAEPEEATPPPASTPLAPTASVERVKRAESEFASAEAAVTDDTPLREASELFNSAAVALELAWLRLFVDAGCITDEQKAQAEAAVSAYTSALQQDLTTTGHYTGAIDGIYGPMTVQAVEDLQTANDLPVTGTVDKATAEALQAELVAVGGAAAQESVASTAAVQQTLKLVGFWDGPVDGVWTPELTEAVMAFQTELGVEPTGAVDAVTIAAFEQALAELEAAASPTPTPTPSATQ